MSEQMAEDLFRYPWISKSRGKTIHLLKRSAVQVRKKPIRKQYPLLDQSKRTSIDLFAGLKQNQKKQVTEKETKIEKGPKQLFGPPKKLFPEDQEMKKVMD